MLVLSHPTGNAFVRALLRGLITHGCDLWFYTTLAWRDPAWASLLPGRLRKELQRRNFPVPPARCRQRPFRELGRLCLQRFSPGVRNGKLDGWFGIDAVYSDLDRYVAGELEDVVDTVYAYEDGALNTFQTAKIIGAKCCYELPIAYWETGRRLLEEEAQRYPEWEPTLVGTSDAPEKCERKTRELVLADTVVCPSRFVLESLPATVRSSATCIVAEFGSPPSTTPLEQPRRNDTRLRILFAGSMSQRKGLADLFAAMRLLGRSDLELVVLGAPVLPLEFYRRQYPDFRYEPPRPHDQVLAFMRQCDVLALPSIVEGRALVQQEALSCGLPLIVTANAGGQDLVDEGQTGFLVPIRAPDKIAAAIAWFADHRTRLPEMADLARAKAAQYTWERYSGRILEAILGQR